jgi:hypothetical protein
MAGSQRGRALPTQLGLGQFEQFVLPHLSIGRRGPAPKLGLHKIFNYILLLFYLGCQWKELPTIDDEYVACREAAIEACVAAGDQADFEFWALRIVSLEQSAGLHLPAPGDIRHRTRLDRGTESQ